MDIIYHRSQSILAGKNAASPAGRF